jgi:hypothetical protein
MKTFQEAYHDSKPRPVRQLLDMPIELRWPFAQGLAHAGYIIDVPIDVWGWDALTTMTVRQNMGYTWVPSALQPPVSVVPGVNFPGLPGYDPASPPPGSVRVSTAIGDYPTAQDLIAALRPFFSYRNLAGSPDPYGVGSTYTPLPTDTADVGEVYEEGIAGLPGFRQYEKVERIGGGGGAHPIIEWKLVALVS